MARGRITQQKLEAARKALRNMPRRPIIVSETAEHIGANFNEIYEARCSGVTWKQLVVTYFHDRGRPSLRTLLRIFKELCGERRLEYLLGSSRTRRRGHAASD